MSRKITAQKNTAVAGGKKNRRIGIEVTNSLLRLIELDADGAQYRIQQAKSQPLSYGIYMDGTVRDARALKAALKILVHGVALTELHIAVRMSHKAFHISPTVEELGADIGTNKKTADNSRFFAKPKTNGQKNEELWIGKNNMIITALTFSSATTHSLREILRDITSAPVILLPEAAALSGSLIEKNRTDNSYSIILDIGQNHTQIIATDGKVVLEPVNLTFAGEQITAALKRNLDCSFEEAERMKIERGILPFLTVKPVAELRAEIKNIIIKIEQMRHIITRIGGTLHTTRQIILSGGTGLMSGLREYLAKETGLTVTYAAVWQNVLDLEENIPSIEKHQSMSLATVIGAAVSDK